MATLPESPKWDGIYQLEKTDPVLGGQDGISNRQATELGNRTAYLKQQHENLDSAAVKKDQNLADLSDKAMARKSLELGNSATLNVGTESGTVADGNDSRMVNALDKAKNLTDLKDAATSRKSLGLGTAATANVQASATDAAAGAVMTVGAFGLGGAIIPLAGSMNSTTLPSGLYYAGSQATDKPNGNTESGHLIVSYQGTNIKHYWSPLNSAIQRFRSATSGVWTEWVTVWDSSNFPVGIPMPWPTAAPPAGWLKCNGQSFNTTTYPLLAHAYPSGTLPDLRGQFIRGWADNSTSIDVGRAILSPQSGTLAAFSNSNVAALTGTISAIAADTYPSGGSYAGAGIKYTTPAGTSAVADNAGIVRPTNIAFNYIVRAA